MNVDRTAQRVRGTALSRRMVVLLFKQDVAQMVWFALRHSVTFSDDIKEPSRFECQDGANLVLDASLGATSRASLPSDEAAGKESSLQHHLRPL